ncbi:MAG TPA: hypothetical protein VEJ47_05015 [Candidatus Eremiobacteraceae bacterium]|nr:hypothetical protein [Candidatus Eremiobacteraceae bacterium]
MKTAKRDREQTLSLLIITGTMGAGKTAVLGEASDLLTQRRVVHAAVDLDALGLAHLPVASANDGLMYQNLRSIYANYEGAGVRRFLLARALEDESQLKLCRDIFPGAKTMVCRITASREVMEQRVSQRDSGVARNQYVSRVAELNVILDRARLEHSLVINENRPLTEVALEMLVKAGWL